MPTTSSVDILRAYLEINEITPVEQFLVAGSVVEAHPDRHILNYSKKWYALSYFQQFVQGKLSLEKFMGVGDRDSTLTIFEQKTYLKWGMLAWEELKGLAGHVGVIVLLDQIGAEYMQAREPQQREEFEKHVQTRKWRIVILDKFVYTAPEGEIDPYAVNREV